MSLYLIAEFGSCHMGKLARIKEAIDQCSDLGIDALKLQLFPNEKPYVPNNVWLDPVIFTMAFDYGGAKGVDVSASVFDQKALDFLITHKPQFIKLAFSKKHETKMLNQILEAGLKPIVSCDVLTEGKIQASTAEKLYCIPEYPVRYEIAFDGLFPRFDGFSDHTLGIRQTKRAIEAGAKIIEKHVRLGYGDETCPDAQFAVLIKEFASVRV